MNGFTISFSVFIIKLSLNVTDNVPPIAQSSVFLIKIFVCSKCNFSS